MRTSAIKWRLPMKLIVEVSFASTFESSLILLISLLPIQTLFTIKLHQHFQWLHLTFDTASDRTWYRSFQTEKGQYHYPDHQRSQQDSHLMLWTTYQILPPLEFVVPCVYQRKGRIEHMCFVPLPILSFVFKKTVIAFNNTIPNIDFLPLSNKYFMDWWRHHIQYDYLWPFILQFILYIFRVVNDNIKYTSWYNIQCLIFLWRAFYRHVITIKDQKDTSVPEVSRTLEAHMKNLLLQFFITTSKDKHSTNFF